MDKFTYIICKKSVKAKQRSLDMALSYLKDHLQLRSDRWLKMSSSSVRIGRSSYERIVIPAIEDINLAVSRDVPEFKAFNLIRTSWRKDKYHKTIERNRYVNIQEDEKHFYIEVQIP